MIVQWLMGGKTFVEKFDLGNGIKRFKCREDDNFLRFKEKGTLYIILKTIAPRVDRWGNRYFFVFESDIHTFDIENGKILDPVLEKEFKKRIKLEEIYKFKSMIKEVEEEVIKDKAKEILSYFEVSDEEKESEQELELIIPAIKLGKTAEVHIDNLTPHDTINEVNSLLLDGKILTSVLKSAKENKWMILGGMIVGSALTIIATVLFAILFPEQWHDFAT